MARNQVHSGTLVAAKIVPAITDVCRRQAGKRSWSDCGEGCSRLLLTKCCSTYCRRAPAASDHRWCSAACIGVRPELVAEVKFLTWTDDNLLRQVAYEGLREDKPAAQVRR
jgi:hypothetical protein